MKWFVSEISLKELCNRYPHARDFLQAFGDYRQWEHGSIAEYFAALDDSLLESRGFRREDLSVQLDLYLDFMQQLQEQAVDRVEAITIIGGQDKAGNPEDCEITVRAGDIVCIVGPTGAGKSRLLADIEWLAQEDTPTGRRILLNGKIPPPEMRFSVERKLVAQLSQNMNFIMDLSVREFIAMHAESRMREDVPAVTDTILNEANRLAGEPFQADTPITSLSGGQSRALMIADTAFLSTSPIVLIDEIENAGIDRQNALSLLVNQQKIVLMATHDPYLALLGKRRIVIGNGGIQNVLETSRQEQDNLLVLQQLDHVLTGIRQTIRSGGRLDTNLTALLNHLGKPV
ncbi:hypothetical protein P22_0935 [Propionispora sp. 2/2-37]|uniref:ATP-binding cassette domain-containing protein n=1 Tax=Propionispora sp. 2/2-37 TaxID=1677858 RepID=UPI0006BB7F75|nr:ATP-binding cassette domain-containing protein [Propionispora sp. 2/2-37]CUH94869.1 hypothetical protein P22_0935 [Propionispora sp. 2/2-37]